MATSTNYGWAEPDNSSLVKNGAQDIRTLGNAIDTSVWNVGFGQAGKNKIINGNFAVWQRGTSFTVPVGSWQFNSDRFQCYTSYTSGTTTVTQQTFTPATAPVAGYEGQFFLRMTAATIGNNPINIRQLIEDVRTFAGQTITVSFWAKASATTAASIALRQDFGTGGSSYVEQTSSLSVTTSWTRFTSTFTTGSMSGKTIGTGSSLQLWLLTTGNFTAGATLDTWGWQVEQGSIATPFQTASGGSPQAELAMCQRYYIRLGNSAGNSNQRFAVGPGANSTVASITAYLPVKLRVPVSSIDYSTLSLYDGSSAFAVTAAAINAASDLNPNVNFTVASGLTAKQFYEVTANNNVNGYIGFNAEL
jgi:hypothetical protein